MPTDKTKSYYVKIGAGIGHLLLGGHRTHESSRFETRSQAWNWARQSIDTNEKAGRAVAKVQIWPSVKDPEIPD